MPSNDLIMGTDEPWNVGVVDIDILVVVVYLFWLPTTTAMSYSTADYGTRPFHVVSRILHRAMS